MLYQTCFQKLQYLFRCCFRDKIKISEADVETNIELQHLISNGKIIHKGTDNKSIVLYYNNLVFKYFKPRKGIECYIEIMNELGKVKNDNILFPVEIVMLSKKNKIIEISNYCQYDLFTYVEKTDRFKYKELNILIGQIMDAIHFLHNTCNLAHRDIKPENILLSFDNESNPIIQLIDFDFCCKLNDTDCFYGGTIVYASPELVNNSATSATSGTSLDWAKLDIWALGVVIHILLFKVFPWKIATTEDVYYLGYKNSINTEKYWSHQFKERLGQLPKKYIKYIYILKKSLSICPNDRTNCEYLLKLNNT